MLGSSACEFFHELRRSSRTTIDQSSPRRLKSQSEPVRSVDLALMWYLARPLRLEPCSLSATQQVVIPAESLPEQTAQVKHRNNTKFARFLAK